MVARNFGYQFKTYNGIRERLPLKIDLGYTKILEQFPVAVTVTAHDLQNSTFHRNTITMGRKFVSLERFSTIFPSVQSFSRKMHST
ncbi:hypothetical protein [Chryseobacterium taklimakanense]|uniref:hypothetical protein n=1 Tax=Chryseobacterium taklimakanense TaxID=536441 RepID=UPI001E544849|nr:hypothetical protein [Chryseobacterium taklimakanense]